MLGRQIVKTAKYPNEKLISNVDIRLYADVLCVNLNNNLKYMKSGGIFG